MLDFAQKMDVEKTCYPSGKLRYEVPLIDGKENGLLKFYYVSGALEQEIVYKNDKMEGVSKAYHKNGRLTNETTYKNDKQNGIAIFYSKDGSGELCMRITYKDDKVISAKKKNGKPLNNAELSNLKKGLRVSCE